VLPPIYFGFFIDHLYLSNCKGDVCRMGESCGALTRGIMVIGLAIGSERLEDLIRIKESWEILINYMIVLKKNMIRLIVLKFRKKVISSN